MLRPQLLAKRNFTPPSTNTCGWSLPLMTFVVTTIAFQLHTVSPRDLPGTVSIRQLCRIRWISSCTHVVEFTDKQLMHIKRLDHNRHFGVSGLLLRVTVLLIFLALHTTYVSDVTLAALRCNKRLDRTRYTPWMFKSAPCDGDCWCALRCRYRGPSKSSLIFSHRHKVMKRYTSMDVPL